MYYWTAIFSVAEMKLAVLCSFLVDAGIRQSWGSIVDILSRSQVWQLRHHTLIPGRGRDFSLLQSAHASSGSHPASCSVGMGVAWHEADHSCPFTVVLRLSVWSWTSAALNACMARTGTALQIPDCTENTELDSCLKSGFYTLIVEFSLHLLFLDTNDSVFSSLNWWIGCCIFLWVCMNPSSF